MGVDSMCFVSMALILFLIMDPIGNISPYLSLVGHLNGRDQHRIVLREMGCALLVMLAFNYLGVYLFDFLGFSEITVRVSSGVILFLIAIKILFPSSDSLRAYLPPGEPKVFPIAVPLIAGPGLMATLLLYGSIDAYQSFMLPSILAAWFAAVLILYFSATIRRTLGSNGLMAAERLIGMILVLIAVQRFLEGVLLFWKKGVLI